MGWPVELLGQLADISYGYTAKASFEINGPKFLRITDIQDGNVNWEDVPSCEIAKADYEKHKLFVNDIVFARTGATTGKSFLIKKCENSVAASYLIRVRPTDNRLLPDFLYLYFQSAEYWGVVNAGTSGSAQGGFNASKLAGLTIPIPPTSEQKRIVAILDQAFADIDKARALTEQNLKNARELFESCLNGLLLSVCSLEPTQTLSCITELIVDCEHKTAPVQDEGYPSIRTPNIGKGELLLDGVKRVSKETYEIWTKRATPKSGDLILAREAPAGNVGVIPKGLQVCLGQRTVLIRPDQTIVNSSYLALFMLHPIMQKRLLAHSTGATVQHINMKDIRGLSIAKLPSLKKQQADVEALAEAKREIDELELIYLKKLGALEELKRSLLHQAFSAALTEDSEEAAA